MKQWKKTQFIAPQNVFLDTANYVFRYFYIPLCKCEAHNNTNRQKDEESNFSVTVHAFQHNYGTRTGQTSFHKV